MATEKNYEGFSADEIAAMKERAAELKAAGKRKWFGKSDESTESGVLGKIAKMPAQERAIAEKLHEIAKANGLTPDSWYGMPVWEKDGKKIVFFKSAAKFKVRYAEVGFNEDARLDDGEMWPTAYAVTALTPAVEQRLAELVQKAVD